jgi:dephospho-CoA kinase
MLFNKKPRILALVGMPGAGKTLCAKFLEEQGFFQYRFGGIVTGEVVRRGLPLIPENERKVREEIRANEGMDAIARRALPHLREALRTHLTIVIDGLYSFAEYKLLQQTFDGDMVVVAITCARPLRYERLTSRADRPLTVEEAIQRDIQEIETLEKGGPIAMADNPSGFIGSVARSASTFRYAAELVPASQLFRNNSS